MIAEQLEALIHRGETLDVEFKGEERHPLGPGALVEAVVCLANRSGERPGWLLVGVEDDGRITGARSPDGHPIDPRRVEALLANKTRPSLACRAEVIVVGGQNVLVIEVPPSRVPVSDAQGRFLRRAQGARGPECVPMHYPDLLAFQATHGMDYSALPVSGATWEDLDPLEFERVRRFIREYQRQSDGQLLDLTNQELAKALGAVEANHDVRSIRVLGLLLFGREDRLRQLLPTNEVAFQALQGTRLEKNEFYRMPLLRVLEELLSHFRARNQEQEILDGMMRIPIPDYPERAFREAVANALVHRDYTRLGAVHVQWLEDRLEISSPGGFPEGVRLDNLLVTPPRPRNPLLADAFKRLGLVDRTGRGIDTIFQEQLRNGRPAPLYDRSSSSDVVVVLPGGAANLEFVRMVHEESRAGRPLGLDPLLLLNHLWLEREIGLSEAAALIQKSEAEARRTLQFLVEEGLVESRRDGRSRTFHLSATVYRRLGSPAAYTRQRAFEPVQQEAMVLQQVRRFGSISRSEAADLCRISPSGAYQLLRSLVDAGKLRKLGDRGRYARYELAD